MAKHAKRIMASDVERWPVAIAAECTENGFGQCDGSLDSGKECQCPCHRFPYRGEWVGADFSVATMEAAHAAYWRPVVL